MKQPVVLYVEDDALSREIMHVLLSEDLGLSQFTIFEDSENFMARVEALNPKPDVIFLDIHVMPHTGFEMLEMLLAHPAYQGLPIVALTASVMNEEVHRLRTAGFSGVIAKPIDVDTFSQTLNRILSGEEVWRVID